MAERVAVGDPVTYAYGERCVHARVAERNQPYEDAFGMTCFLFRPRPVQGETAIPVTQFDHYEGITWERGWTDGVALLAAHALAVSR